MITIRVTKPFQVGAGRQLAEVLKDKYFECTDYAHPKKEWEKKNKNLLDLLLMLNPNEYGILVKYVYENSEEE